MAGNRSVATALALEWVNDIDRSGKSGKFLQEYLGKLSNTEFEEWIVKLENKQDYVPLIMDFNDDSISYENNIKVAKKRGVEIFQQIWFVDPQTKILTLTPEKYPVYLLPVRRQIESIEYKISISSSNMKIDANTGQVIGNDQASRFSYPEVMVSTSKELNYSLLEFMKYRGGDVRGRVEFNNLLRNTGSVAMDNLMRTKTNVKSTESLEAYFLAMHWQVNLTG